MLHINFPFNTSFYEVINSVYFILQLFFLFSINKTSNTLTLLHFTIIAKNKCFSIDVDWKSIEPLRDWFVWSWEFWRLTLVSWHSCLKYNIIDIHLSFQSKLLSLWNRLTHAWYDSNSKNVHWQPFVLLCLLLLRKLFHSTKLTRAWINSRIENNNSCFPITNALGYFLLV